MLKRRPDKKSAISFLSRLVRCYPAARIIVTDKLKSYIKTIERIRPKTERRTDKSLNNPAKNVYQPACRKEKSLIKLQSPQGAQNTL